MRLARIVQAGFLVLASLAVYSFVSAARDGERRRLCTPLCATRPAYAARNRLAPDFDLPALDGRRIRLADFRGTVVILNFWTKTCRPCLEEMGSLADLARMLRGRDDVVLLTVSTDAGPEDVRATLDSVVGRDPPFTTLVDPDGAIVTGKFGTRLYPETWFVDPHGVIRARFDGARAWSSPMTLDLAKSFLDPIGCAVEFSRSAPAGRLAGFCEAIGTAG